MDYDVKDMKLADQGKLKIEWAEATMPVLRLIRKRFQNGKAVQGPARDRLPPRDDRNRQSDENAQGRRSRCPALRLQSAEHAGRVAAALVEHDGIPTFAIKGEDNKTYYRHIQSAIAHKPQITMDDGADVVSLSTLQAEGLAQAT